MIYLDNAASTKIDPDVLSAMMPYLTDEYGNPGTVYSLGRRAKYAIDKARRQVAEFIGASPENIVFTSGGTEANNMALNAMPDIMKKIGKRRVITTSVEHASVLNTARNLCIKHEFDLTELPVCAYGNVDLSLLEGPIMDDAGFVSVMYVNNETGSENPVCDIGGICAQRGVVFHTDCVQAAGGYDIDVNTIGCDLLSISSHKIHGPKGVGALYIRDASVMSPLIYGGTSQEGGLRGGTENVPGIVGFGAACEWMRRNTRLVDMHTTCLKDMFYNELVSSLKRLKIYMPTCVHINGRPASGRGKTLNIRFDGVDGETLLVMLDSNGVCVSAGSACNSHESKPSHVLLAMGIDEEDARNSIRISFSKMNTEEDVVSAARIMARCVQTLRL